MMTRVLAGSLLAVLLVVLIWMFTPLRCVKTQSIDDQCTQPPRPSLPTLFICEVAGLGCAWGIARAGRSRGPSGRGHLGRSRRLAEHVATQYLGAAHEDL